MMMSRKMTRAAIAAMFVVALAGGALTLRGESASKAFIGQPAPSFSLQDQNGKTVSLGDFAGKIVVLEWVNPQCPFVQRHYKAKTMTTLADKYKGKDVAWIAINSGKGDSASADKQFASRHGVGYPILSDSDQTLAREYDAKTTPDMFIINKDGKLVYAGAIDDDPDGSKGASATNYVAKALDEVLAGKSVSTPETKSYGCGVHK